MLHKNKLECLSSKGWLSVTWRLAPKWQTLDQGEKNFYVANALAYSAAAPMMK
jgi:hypothetical protein